MFEVCLLVMLALPVGGALYHWPWYRMELAAMRWFEARSAGKLASITRPRRKPPTKDETQRAIRLAACERKWRRRLTVAA